MFSDEPVVLFEFDDDERVLMNTFCSPGLTKQECLEAIADVFESYEDTYIRRLAKEINTKIVNMDDKEFTTLMNIAPYKTNYEFDDEEEHYIRVLD